MSSSENPYSVETVADVPSLEIARNIARLNRLDFALDQSHLTDARSGSDWGSDDGRILSVIADRVAAGERLEETAEYNFGVFFALQASNPMSSVLTLPRASAELDRTDIKVLASRSQVLEVDAYLRVGDIFIKKRGGGIRATIGAFAAAAFIRADIKNPVDRSLYDREKDIEKLVTRLETKVAPRTRKFTAGRAAGVVAMKEISVFREIGDTLNTPPELRTDLWWSELRTDLNAIDTLAKSK